MFRAARAHAALAQGGAWWWMIAGTLAVQAHAAELSYGFQYEAERSSNIRRVPVNEQEETVDSVGLSARYRENLPNFRSEVAASTERRHFRNGTFQDETLLFLDGTAIWLPTPQFSWTVADSFRNVPASRALPDTPANREDTNVFLTGPTIEWRLAPADHLITEARVGRFDAERSDVDNDRHSAALRWRRRHSSLAENSLNYEYLRVEFDNDVQNANYERRDAFYRGVFRRARNQITLDLGRTNIDRERNPEIDGSLFRLTATREVSSTRRMGVNLSAEYSDTAFSLAPSGITSETPTAGTAAEATSETLTGDVFYTRRAEAFLTGSAVPLLWTVTVFTGDVDYEMTTSDVEDRGGIFTVSYLRTANLSFNLYSNYTRSIYTVLNRTDRDVVNGASVAYRLSRSLQVSLEGQRAERRSSDPLQPFVDDRVFLRLAYNVTRPWN